MWLAIETASSYMGVALWQPQDNLLIVKGESLGRGMSAALHPLLRSVFSEAGFGPESLTGIVVSRGPGSFTSLRLGVAAAQGLALPWRTPVYGLSAFEQAITPFVGQEHNITVWLKAKEQEVYTQSFSALGEPLTTMVAQFIDDARAELKPGLWVGNGVPVAAEPPAGVIVPEHPYLRLPDMAWMVQQGPRLQQQGAIDLGLHYIKPLNYRTLADVALLNHR